MILFWELGLAFLQFQQRCVNTCVHPRLKPSLLKSGEGIKKMESLRANSEVPYRSRHLRAEPSEYEVPHF